MHSDTKNKIKKFLRDTGIARVFGISWAYHPAVPTLDETIDKLVESAGGLRAWKDSGAAAEQAATLGREMELRMVELQEDDATLSKRFKKAGGIVHLALVGECVNRMSFGQDFLKGPIFDATGQIGARLAAFNSTSMGNSREADRLVVALIGGYSQEIAQLEGEQQRRDASAVSRIARRRAARNGRPSASPGRTNGSLA
jgi:hypothetical protein